MEQWQERFAETLFRRAADTAHDLKTPLNIAVLSLELLRMRVQKIAGEDDEKIRDYAVAVEAELRRLASIFDAFFVHAIPPPGAEAPQWIDSGAVFSVAAGKSGIPLTVVRSVPVLGHTGRIEAAVRLFCEGASRLLSAGSARAEIVENGELGVLVIEGDAVDPEVELGKVFKFHYTDPSGAPDLSLATARLIAETYGGGLTATRENDRLRLELLFPQGGQ
jgi:hypothetical protein